MFKSIIYKIKEYSLNIYEASIIEIFLSFLITTIISTILFNIFGKIFVSDYKINFSVFFVIGTVFLFCFLIFLLLKILIWFVNIVNNKFINKNMQNIKNYKIILIILIILGIIFYWFEIRPSQARKDCSSKSYSDTLYKKCLREKGLEK